MPILDEVSAGKLKQPVSQIPQEDAPFLVLADLGRGEHIALTVRGDSMDFLAPDGAIIIVDKADRDLVSGKPFAIVDRGETSFKIWKPRPIPRWQPWSHNPINEPIYVKSIDAAEKMVIGRVKRAIIDLT